jgi:hypothetical protein
MAFGFWRPGGVAVGCPLDSLVAGIHPAGFAQLHGQKFTLRLLQHLAKRQTVTLLCHCAEDEKHCHRHLLKALLEKKI